MDFNSWFCIKQNLLIYIFFPSIIQGITHIKKYIALVKKLSNMLCMKFLSSQLSIFMQQRGAKRNIAFLLRFILLLILMIASFSIIFHYLMQYEERTYSWITGVYWTLTVMSTLGFGDITFTSDMGRLFSIIVMLSGVIFLLVMLPFTFIQFFYAPWLEAQKKQSTPRSLPASTKDHLIFVDISPLTLNTVDVLERYGTKCVLLCNDTQTTLDLIDQGYDAIVGDHDDSIVYKNLHIENAAMLIALDNDVRNTNITFTARDVDANVPIIASVQSDDAIDILSLAGATHVIQFHKLLGIALARRIINEQAPSSIINQYHNLVIAEAPVMRTILVGKSLIESELRNKTGVNVVGVWERGKFISPQPSTVFTDASVLVMAGTSEQIKAVDKLLGQRSCEQHDGPILILGGGRVGMAAAQHLDSIGREYRIVDKNTRLRHNLHKDNLILGDAADLDVLEEAGLRKSPSVLITTHDDDTNIYLTLYCRRLRPDIQIISRATLDRNVGILHAAGADLVLSLASMMTSSVINLLAPGKVFMLNEGLKIFRSTVSKKLSGEKLMDSGIRSLTHCSVVALSDKNGTMHVNPDPEHILTQGEEMFLIGDMQAEQSFYEKFGDDQGLTKDKDKQ